MRTSVAVPLAAAVLLAAPSAGSGADIWRGTATGVQDRVRHHDEQTSPNVVWDDQQHYQVATADTVTLQLLVLDASESRATVDRKLDKVTRVERRRYRATRSAATAWSRRSPGENRSREAPKKKRVMPAGLPGPSGAYRFQCG